MSLSIGCSGRLIPRGYKNVNYNYDEALPLGKYPTCAWSSDAFTNWITQNGINITTNILLSTVGIALAPATGGASVLATAGIVANTIGQFRNASLMPSLQGGNNTGDITMSTVTNKFALHHMRAKTEYLKIIDDYFTRYGYKTNTVKVPNITGRQYWNYIEIGSSEEIGTGQVPSKHMEIINNACRKGVTIWHNHDSIGNYLLNNIII